MRRGGLLWEVTFRDRSAELYDELPVYFKTRRAAQHWADELTTNPYGHGYAEGDVFIARPAPDDVTVRDIEWDDYA